MTFFKLDQEDHIELVSRFVDEPIRAIDVFHPNARSWFLGLGPSGWIDLIFHWLALRRGGISSFTMWVVTDTYLYILILGGTLRGFRVREMLGRWRLDETSGRRVKAIGHGPVEKYPFAMRVQVPDPDGERFFEVTAGTFRAEAKQVIDLICGVDEGNASGWAHPPLSMSDWILPAVLLLGSILLPVVMNASFKESLLVWLPALGVGIFILALLVKRILRSRGEEDRG